MAAPPSFLISTWLPFRSYWKIWAWCYVLGFKVSGLPSNFRLAPNEPMGLCHHTPIQSSICVYIYKYACLCVCSSNLWKSTQRGRWWFHCIRSTGAIRSLVVLFSKCRTTWSSASAPMTSVLWVLCCVSLSLFRPILNSFIFISVIFCSIILLSLSFSLSCATVPRVSQVPRSDGSGSLCPTRHVAQYARAFQSVACAKIFHKLKGPKGVQKTQICKYCPLIPFILSKSAVAVSTSNIIPSLQFNSFQHASPSRRRHSATKLPWNFACCGLHESLQIQKSGPNQSISKLSTDSTHVDIKWDIIRVCPVGIFYEFSDGTDYQDLVQLCSTGNLFLRSSCPMCRQLRVGSTGF